MKQLTKTSDKSSPQAKTWQELNQRQQATLTAIYKSDQKAEQQETTRWRLWRERTPADVWRKLRYPPLAGIESPLHRFLRVAEVIDPGLGSTLQALERRNLVECGWDVDGDLLWIKLTNFGRATVRAGTGEKPPKKQPKGQLRPRQWEALQVAYQAGKEGIKDSLGLSDYSGFSYQYTWSRLCHYYGSNDGLVAEISYWENGKSKYKICITKKGKDFYECNKEAYKKLYSTGD